MLSLSRHIVTLKGILLHVTRFGDEADQPDLLMLPGFLGSGMQFHHLLDELNKFVNPVTVDIKPDTGYLTSISSNEPEDNSGIQKTILDASLLSDGIQKVITGADSRPLFVLGYSMGARLVLSWAVRYPGFAAGLILESGTAGIEDSSVRAERRESDEKLAEKIMSDYSAFLEDWEQNPLFHPPDSEKEKTQPGSRANTGEPLSPGETGESLSSGETGEPLSSGVTGESLSPYETVEPLSSGESVKPLPSAETGGSLSSGEKNEPKASLKSIQEQQNPTHMARWLRDFGTGVMPPLFDKLHTITCPVLLITGGLDQKFCNIGAEMQTLLRDGRHHIVQGAAHRVHIDAPDAYLAPVRKFVRDCIDRKLSGKMDR